MLGGGCPELCTLLRGTPTPLPELALSGQITGAAGAAGEVWVNVASGGQFVDGCWAAADGTFSFPHLPPGSYTVAPFAEQLSFSPASREVTLGTAPATEVTFAASASSAPPAVFCITGYVRDPMGVALQGISVRAEGEGGNFRSKTAGNGRYCLAGLPPGVYTVRASYPGLLFSPAQRVVTVSAAWVRGVDFQSDVQFATPAPSPTATPAPSPTPTPRLQIAFQSVRATNADIWLIYGDGTGLVQLTDSPASDFSPAWSPDGQWLAFVSDRAGNNDIWLMHADGSGLRNLTQSPANDLWPAWSPDGSQIVYASDAGEGWDLEIFTISVAGGSPVQLTDNDVDDAQPCWSPDGSLIAYISIPEGNWDIFAMPPDGSAHYQLTTDPADDYWPAWSPDGLRLAFRSDRAGNGDIFSAAVVDHTLAAVTNLTAHPAWDDQPAWSPDGSRMAFVSNRSGDIEIYTIPAAGGEATQLTQSPGDDSAPAWRPLAP